MRTLIRPTSSENFTSSYRPVPISSTNSSTTNMHLYLAA